MASNFPSIFDTRSLRNVVDQRFEDLVINFGESIEDFFLPLLKLVIGLEDLLTAVPWYIILIAIGAIAYHASRCWKRSLLIMLLLFLCGAIGYWEETMQTIVLMLVSTLMAVFIGLPMGIFMARSDRVERVFLPVLDIMQTLPTFVYLIPFVMLLGPGKVPAVLATLVFALPPIVRLTNLGIRQVDPAVVEAADAFGTTARQKLFTVEFPLALPTIMTGINQTTMLALSMVVIASMIGAGGLGYQVLQGIQRLEVSKGLLAGLAIVFLAIIFDRIAQAYGKRTAAMRSQNTSN